MKKNNFKLLLSAISASAVLLSVSPSAMAAAEVANGNVCMAANLNQAFELKWDHARVENPATNPFSRFVTCSMGAGSQWLRNDGAATGVNVSAVDSGRVTAYFSADAADDAEVSCVFREMAASATGTVPADSKVVTMTAPASLPGTANGLFADEDGVNITTTSSLTVTCKLDPGTGINSFGVSKALPGA